MSDSPPPTITAVVADDTASGSCRTDCVYFDGAVRAAAEAAFPPTDHGVLFGLGFFETFRTSGGRPHQIARHWRRLLGACAETGIALPAHFLARDTTRFAGAVAELLRAHGGDDAVLRYTVTAGGATESGEKFVVPGRPLVIVRGAP